MSEKKPTGIVALFFRENDGEEFFYPIQFMGEKWPTDEAADHAAMNPGTLRIEDASGTVLWAAESAKA